MTEAIADLVKHVDRHDFAVCTYPIVTKINELLTTLVNAEEEGNTREILRQLRNTLMNGGWKHYRDPAVCKHVVEIFKFLGEAEEVLPQKVDEVFEKLATAGLDMVGLPLVAAVEEDEASDGEISEEQVPRGHLGG